MAVVSGQATSFDLPNYIGELFEKKKYTNAVLRLVGGLTGMVRTVTDWEFPMGVDYELPAAAQPAILEGAAPTGEEVDTAQSSNVVQIFQEAVDLTYTRLARSGSIDGVALIPGQSGNGAHNNPGTLEWQIDRALEKVARDANYSFLRGTYAKPASNATARQTRGIRTAVTTNLFANAATPRAITKAIINAALRDMVANGAFQQGEEVFMLADATQFSNVAALYAGDTQLPESREVAGVAIKRFITDWAVVNLVYENDMAAGEVFIAQPSKCRVTGLLIPQKGLLFAEPLAKTGSAEKYQVYGELGIDYTHEVLHGVIDDLS